jgi:hypothetical protein
MALGPVVLLALLVSSVSCMTSLELAVASAFNLRVSDGTWETFIGYPGSGLTDSNFCPGPLSTYPFPSDEKGTDLDHVISAGALYCGHPKNTYLLALDGQVLLDTTGPYAKGRLVDFFTTLGTAISSNYGPRVDVIWNTSFTTPDDVFEALELGEIDAACAHFAVGLTVGYDGVSTPRSFAFSLFQCVSYLQNPYIYSRSSDPYTTWDEVITEIQKDSSFQFCTSVPASGDETSICTNVVRQYAVANSFSCVGKGIFAYSDLASGTCDAVWGGPSTVDADFVNFSSPVYTPLTSFFRDADYYNSGSVVKISSFVLILALLFCLFL